MFVDERDVERSVCKPVLSQLVRAVVEFDVKMTMVEQHVDVRGLLNTHAAEVEMRWWWHAQKVKKMRSLLF